MKISRSVYGRRFRTLPMVDNYTSECLAIDVGRA